MPWSFNVGSKLEYDGVKDRRKVLKAKRKISVKTKPNVFQVWKYMDYSL